MSSKNLFMENILIASNSSSTMTLISEFMSREEVERIVPCQSAETARRNIIETPFDLIVIDTPLTDEYGEDLAVYAADKSSAGIILVVDDKVVASIGRNAESYGIFVMGRNEGPSFFYQAARLLAVSRKRVMYLENEKLRLQKRLDEMKIIDRAKIVLVQVLKMTEVQAQRYIEKQSMDLRQSRLTVAENILRTYDY